MANKKNNSRNTLNLLKNLKLYYVAIGVVILGYVLLSIGGANSITSLTLGPIVLVIAYVIVLPIALLYGVRRKDTNQAEPDSR